MLLGDGGGWLAAGLRELRFLVGFGGVGLLATATHIGSATLLVAAFGFDPKWAAVLGVTASAAVSYFGHIHVTFRIDADHGDEGILGLGRVRADEIDQLCGQTEQELALDLLKVQVRALLTTAQRAKHRHQSSFCKVAHSP